MPAEAKTLLDAVNQALEPTPTETPTPPVETPEPSEPETPPAAAAPEGEGAAPEGDTPAGEEKPEGEEAPEGEAPPEAGKPEKPETPAKAADPVNDPIPATVSERTRERITSLVGLVKEKDTQIAQRDALVDTIQSTGVSPENFNATLQFLRLYNSPSIDDKRSAYRFLEGELRGLAKQIGEIPGDEDPLAAHADLRDAVDAGSIGREHAVELARARTRTAATDTNRQALTAQQQEAQRAEAERTAAIGELNALGATLKTTDPFYEAKYAILVPALRPVFASLPPAQWKQAFQAAYANLTVPAGTAVAAAAAAAPAKPNGAAGAPQPLRGNKQPAGDGQRQPKTMLEAVTAGLAGLKG